VSVSPLVPKAGAIFATASPQFIRPGDPLLHTTEGYDIIRSPKSVSSS
jgi:hypothetical protein